MASSRGRNFAIFLVLAVVAIILFGIGAATHQAACQGLDCGGGGGGGGSGGSDVLSTIANWAGILSAAASVIQLVVTITSKP